MPNATGRAATRTPRRSSAAPAEPATPAEPRPERHVRTPLERAQGVYDKAKAASDKIGVKLLEAEVEVAKLKADADEAKVTLDWAASHPLLVAARKTAEEEAPDAADADDTAGEPEKGDAADADDTAGEPEKGDAADTDSDQDEGEGVMPAFDFDNPPPIAAVSTPSASPFDQPAGPSTTHV